MFHFLICQLVCGSNISLFKMFDLGFPMFRQLLVVRITERIQDLSKIKCSGCQNAFRFSSLHPCQKLSLSDRIDMFLPQVLTEALERMPHLVAMFHNKYEHDTTNYEDWGKQFVQQLASKDILDRRFINEDTGCIFEYDNSWCSEEIDLQQVCDDLLNACEEIDAEVTERIEVTESTEPKKKKPKRKYKRNVESILL